MHGFRLGAIDYITKPFQSEEVLARVTTQLTLHQLQTQLRESKERLMRNGEGFFIEGTLSHTEAAGQTLYTLILRDAQERHQADAERRALQGLTQYLEDEVRSAHQVEDLVGDSPALRQVMQLVERVASTDATVLLTGETGTGKERSGSRQSISILPCRLLPGSSALPGIRSSRPRGPPGRPILSRPLRWTRTPQTTQKSP